MEANIDWKKGSKITVSKTDMEWVHFYLWKQTQNQITTFERTAGYKFKTKDTWNMNLVRINQILE
jgi:hypothetical protein